MQIVTGEPAPTQEPEVVRDTLLEMAAVIRTIFGVGLPAAAQQPAPASAAVAPVEPISAPAPLSAVPAPSIPAPAVAVPSLPRTEVAAIDVPDLEAPALTAPRTPTVEAPAAIPVPAIPVQTPPLTEKDHDPAERHSMALLQEIAFLDD